MVSDPPQRPTARLPAGSAALRRASPRRARSWAGRQDWGRPRPPPPACALKAPPSAGVAQHSRGPELPTDPLPVLPVGRALPKPLPAVSTLGGNQRTPLPPAERGTQGKQLRPPGQPWGRGEGSRPPCSPRSELPCRSRSWRARLSLTGRRTGREPSRCAANGLPKGAHVPPALQGEDARCQPDVSLRQEPECRRVSHRDVLRGLTASLPTVVWICGSFFRGQT